MARFTSSKYPSLVVKFSNGERVKFHNREAEVSGETAERLLAFAERHPDYEVKQVEADPKPLTPKQKAAAKARELGLDDSGSQKDIEARIAEHEAQNDGEDDADGDVPDEQDADDQSDAEDSDEDAAGDSAEDE